MAKLPVGYRRIKHVVDDTVEDFPKEGFFDIADIEFVGEIPVKGEGFILETHAFIKGVDVGSAYRYGKPGGRSMGDVGGIARRRRRNLGKGESGDLAFQLQLTFVLHDAKVGVPNKVVLQFVREHLSHIGRSEIGVVEELRDADCFGRR